MSLLQPSGVPGEIQGPSPGINPPIGVKTNTWSGGMIEGTLLIHAL